MRVTSTRDVSLEDLRNLSDTLGPEFNLEINESQVSGPADLPLVRRISPPHPSWVAFFSDADAWIKLVGGLYLAGLVQEAGKDTWRNRAKIWSGTVAAGHRIKKLAAELGRLRARLPQKTRIQLGLPVPADYGTRIELVGSDVDELALQLALFVDYLPALVQAMRKECLDQSGGIQLRLLPDASLEVSWQDSSKKRQTRVFPFEPCPLPK